MAEITITSKYKKNLTARMHGDSLNIEVTGDSRQFSDTLFTYADAHKLADWIKDNIPEPPPAPPEWRIVIGEERVALMIDLVIGPMNMGIIGSDGIVRDYGISEYDGVTPELHKEMICALLDAHYEMHKGE